MDQESRKDEGLDKKTVEGGGGDGWRKGGKGRDGGKRGKGREVGG